MQKMKKAVYAFIAVLIVAAILAIALVIPPKQVTHIKTNSTIPIIVYTGGLPYTLFNLSFKSMKTSIESTGGSGNISTNSYTLNNFRAAGELADNIILDGYLNKSNSVMSKVNFYLSSPTFSFSGFNSSFGNATLSMSFTLNNYSESNAIIVGLRLFPLEYYPKNYDSAISLESALYPLVYNGNYTDVYRFMDSNSTEGLEYNISSDVPMRFNISDNATHIAHIEITNNRNAPINITSIELAGHFIDNNISSTGLPNVSITNQSIAKLIVQIGDLGIDMYANSSIKFMQINVSKLANLNNMVNAGDIKNVSTFYSYFNKSVNISRLNYLESLMSENKSYYTAMHYLGNFDPENATLQMYAHRIYAWGNMYRGMLDFNVSSNGTLALPESENALNYTGYLLLPGKSASFSYPLASVAYHEVNTSPMENTTYAAFAYFKGLDYSYSSMSYKQ